MDELIIGEKRYVSSKRAAEITGYAKDYVGQLCREGYVEAKMVGRSWYVLESSIREHRFGSEADKGANTDREAKAVQRGERALLGAFEAFAEGNEPEEPESASRESEKSPVSDWERPTYSPEVPAMIPDITPRTKHTADDGGISDPQAPTGPESAIADMQAAWKEWFDQKRGENASEKSFKDDDEPDEIDENEGEILEDVDYDAEEEAIARESEEEEGEDEEEREDGVEIPIQRRQEAPEPLEEAVHIPLRKMPTAAPVAQHHSFAPQGRPAIVPPSALQPMGRDTRTKRAPYARKRRTSLITNAFLVVVAVIAISIALIGSGQVKKYDNHPVIKFLGGTSTVNK